MFINNKLIGDLMTKSYSILDVVKDTVKGNVQKSDATLIGERIQMCSE